MYTVFCRSSCRPKRPRLDREKMTQCGETEENLRKNNSKTAYQLVKDLTAVKQGKATTDQDHSRKCLTKERQILNR